MRFAISTLRVVLAIALLLATWTPASADGDVRNLTRLPQDPEHVVIYIAGWQLLDICLLSPEVACRDVYVNPAWSWEALQQRMQEESLTQQDLFYGHNVQIPTYPIDATDYIRDEIHESRVVYYSYSGDYRFILDTANDAAFDSVAADDAGACLPYQQLEEPVDRPDPLLGSRAGYRCLPYFSKADTSIIAETVDGKTIIEGLESNVFAAFLDYPSIEALAQQFIPNFWRNPLIPQPSQAIAQETFIETVISDAVRTTLMEYGFDEGLLDDSDNTPQRRLFDRRARYLQDLIDSVVAYYNGNVEITIVGHSQGGLVAAYWAGWQGRDSDHVNAIVTLDSPLGRHVSGYGFAKTVARYVPNLSLAIELPALSVPFWGELFPTRQIEIVNYPLGDKLQAALSRLKFKMVRGIDDVIANAAHNVPIYTVRNVRDQFVTANYAGLDGEAWHDKEVDYYDSQWMTLNHESVRSRTETAADLEFVVASGSIYAPTRLDPAVVSATGSPSRRLRIQLAAPAFTRANPMRHPAKESFSVELFHAGEIRAAYTLDVVSVVEEAFYFPRSGAAIPAPPLTLSVGVPANLVPGLYDLVVHFHGELATESVARAFEAVRVEGETAYSTGSIVLVMDRSGSMNDFLDSSATKLAAAKQAAVFLTQLSSTTEGNRLGLLAFNSVPQRVYPRQGPLVEATGANADAYVAAINALDAESGTQLTRALISARQWFDADDINHQTRAIIALTDGRSDDSWRENFVDVPVYTIGFGRESGEFDEDELRRIAADTGGFYRYAPSPAELRALYDAIQRQVSGENGVIQLAKSVSTKTETVNFVIDPTVGRFRLTVNWDANEIPAVDLSLRTPSGVIVNADNHQTIVPDSVLFASPGSWTFSTAAPEGGQWQLLVRGATVANAEGTINITSSSGSPIQLEVLAKADFGELYKPLVTPIWLTNLDPEWSVSVIEEVGATVTLPSGETVEISLFNDGYHGDGLAGDLLFSAVVPPQYVQETGSYVIEVFVRGLLENRDNGRVFAAADGAVLPFQRIFSTVRQVQATAVDDSIADLAGMVVKKPGNSDEYCISYANLGPGTARDAGLFVTAENALYLAADREATRNLNQFSFGWMLGEVGAGEGETILARLAVLDPAQPSELAAWISDGVFLPDSSLGTASVDADAANNASLSQGDLATVAVDSGWTLIGLPRQPTVTDPAAVFCGASGSISVLLGYDNGAQTYDPLLPEYLNTLDAVDARLGYWIRSEQALTINLAGERVSPQTPIELHVGWNLVNYLPAATDTVQHALASIDGLYDAVLGYERGALSYYTEVPPELSTLQALTPGRAYWIHMRQASTLIYPDSVGDAGAAANGSGVEPKDAGLHPSNQWMTVYSESVSIDGNTAPPGTVVKAFAGDGLLVGQTTVDEFGRMRPMTIYGDDTYTAEKDGVAAGDEIVWEVAGLPATVGGDSSPVRWSHHGELRTIQLRAGRSSEEHHVFMPYIQ